MTNLVVQNFSLAQKTRDASLKEEFQPMLTNVKIRANDGAEKTITKHFQDKKQNVEQLPRPDKINTLQK